MSADGLRLSACTRPHAVSHRRRITRTDNDRALERRAATRANGCRNNFWFQSTSMLLRARVPPTITMALQRPGFPSAPLCIPIHRPSPSDSRFCGRPSTGGRRTVLLFGPRFCRSWWRQAPRRNAAAWNCRCRRRRRRCCADARKAAIPGVTAMR